MEVGDDEQRKAALKWKGCVSWPCGRLRRCSEFSESHTALPFLKVDAEVVSLEVWRCA